jgi:hypothetical protein
VEPAGGAAPAVEYRWDPDTEILSAQLQPRSTGKGPAMSVELEGADGSWLILDVAAGRINGVEVAVWPEVHKRSTLSPPGPVEDVSVTVPAGNSKAAVASLEVDVPMQAEADEAERVFHFRLSSAKRARTLRLARDLLVEVDGSSHLIGLWMLNVPPFPAQT